jgi:hypothetical protein
MEQLKQAPRHLSVAVDGVLVGETQINDPETDFRRLFSLPDALAGKKSVEIQIRVTPVVRRGGLEYGLIFGNVAIGP